MGSHSDTMILKATRTRPIPAVVAVLDPATKRMKDKAGAARALARATARSPAEDLFPGPPVKVTSLPDLILGGFSPSLVSPGGVGVESRPATPLTNSEVDESAAAGPASTQYAAGIIHTDSMQGRIVSQRMISPLMPSAAAIRNPVGTREVPDLSINPAGQSTAEEERQLKNRAAVKKHY